MPSREQVLEALGRVIDPELRRPVTELDMVRDLELHDGVVAFTIVLTIAGCPLRDSFEEQVERPQLEPFDVSQEHEHPHRRGSGDPDEVLPDLRPQASPRSAHAGNSMPGLPFGPQSFGRSPDRMTCHSYSGNAYLIGT